MKHETFRRSAPRFADKELPVFPCHPGPGEKRLKRPLVAEGFYAATTDKWPAPHGDTSF